MAGKIIKTFIWSFVLCIVLVIGVLYFLPNMIPEEKIRNEVENVISRSLGEKVKSGKISFSVLPKIEVYVSDLQIGIGKSATRFTDSHFAVSGVGLLFGDKLKGSYRTTINGNKLEGGIFVDNIDKIADNGNSNIQLSLKSPLKFYLSGIAKFKNDGLLLKDFIVRTDNSEGQINIDYHGLPEKQNLDGKIEFSKINIEEIRDILSLFNTTLETEEENTNIVKSGPLWKEDYIDFSFLKSNFNLEIKLNKIVDKDINIGNLDLDIVSKDSLLININKSSFFKGIVFGKIELLDDGQNIAVSKNINFSDVDLGKFLRLYTSIKRVDGFGDLVVKAVSKGHSEKELISNLSGGIFVQILNGTYLGMDLVELANISNDNISEVMKKSDKNTDIRAFESKMNISKGIVEIEKFEVDMPFGQKFSGEGSINLPEYSLDTKLIPAIKVGTVGVSLPLSISGDINKPTYFVNPVSAIVENIDQLEILKTKPAKDIIKGLGQITDNVVEGIGGVGEAVLDEIIPDDSNSDKAIENDKKVDNLKEDSGKDQLISDGSKKNDTDSNQQKLEGESGAILKQNPINSLINNNIKQLKNPLLDKIITKEEKPLIDSNSESEILN